MKSTIRTDGPILPRAARRDIIALICIKLAALFAIYQIFFAPNEHPPVRPADVAQHMIGGRDAR